MRATINIESGWADMWPGRFPKKNPILTRANAPNKANFAVSGPGTAVGLAAELLGGAKTPNKANARPGAGSVEIQV